MWNFEYDYMKFSCDILLADNSLGQAVLCPKLTFKGRGGRGKRATMQSYRNIFFVPFLKFSQTVFFYYCFAFWGDTWLEAS